MNILVTGSNGQLGSELRVIASQDRENSYLFTDVAELDITSEDSVEKFIDQNSVDVIINCAAYTAVDKAEIDFELCDLINHIGPKRLADAAYKYDATLIHISTDYVFNGTSYRPLTEDMAVSPLGVYGKTKLAAEEAILNSGCKSIVIRTSWLYSSFGNNFVKTMKRLGEERESLNVIFDQIGTPTYAANLAEAILKIMPQLIVTPKYCEIYHYSNEGVASWYDFAYEIMLLYKLNCKVNPIHTKDYPTPAERPHYSVMDKSKIKSEFGLAIPHWREALTYSISNPSSSGSSVDIK